MDPIKHRGVITAPRKDIDEIKEFGFKILGFTESKNNPLIVDFEVEGDSSVLNDKFDEKWGQWIWTFWKNL